MVVIVVGRLLVIVALIALVLWIVKGFADARRRQAFIDTRDVRGYPMLPPQQRVTDEQLRARAAQLRKALDRGDITREEAIGSLIRLGGAAVSSEKAERLLSGG